jgi:hypothetical protein
MDDTFYSLNHTYNTDDLKLVFNCVQLKQAYFKNWSTEKSPDAQRLFIVRKTPTILIVKLADME